MHSIAYMLFRAVVPAHTITFSHHFLTNSLVFSLRVSEPNRVLYKHYVFPSFPIFTQQTFLSIFFTPIYQNRNSNNIIITQLPFAYAKKREISKQSIPIHPPSGVERVKRGIVRNDVPLTAGLRADPIVDSLRADRARAKTKKVAGRIGYQRQGRQIARRSENVLFARPSTAQGRISSREISNP